MKIWEKSVLFYLGGTAYMTLEFLWRGRSHGSMFLLGGGCFLALGIVGSLPVSRMAQAVTGAAVVTGLELLTGLGINRDYSVWYYRQLPLQYRGQICLPYSLLWVPVSLAGIVLYARAQRWVRKKAERSR